ncbi:MAG TPA: hypothetical protein VGG61_14235 [Gemmataceae bacterium]
MSTPLQVRTINLTEAEVEATKRFAAWRNDPKIGRVPNYRICDEDDFKLHLVGVRSEYAVSKYCRVPFNLFIDLGGDNNAPDLWVGKRSVQVKCALYEPPILKFNSLEEFRQDLAVLTTAPAENEIKLYGWITRQGFQARYKTKDFGYGLRCTVGIEELLPMPYLKSEMFNEQMAAIERTAK